MSVATLLAHALSRVGGVIFCDTSQRWTGTTTELDALWKRALSGSGVLAWPRLAAVTSLTHPRMFHYFHASIDDFLFVQMVDVTRLIVANKPAVVDVMRPWIQCALTVDCIMPIGAQSVGCRFDKKPQYRYSGCHGQDASALSIVLGLRSGFEESSYAVRARRSRWHWVSESTARREFASLRTNTSDAEYRTEHSSPLDHSAPLTVHANT
ncbi:unnamed protein product [Arctia plantaginis]|uniref:Uncharacterized protein n=1 Tax=Arctia plantaginis TaxID=874455 RepID=A0A8S1AUR8_ARCPL|nr:unnamed protein product [Arctia plantaginis]